MEEAVGAQEDRWTGWEWPQRPPQNDARPSWLPSVVWPGLFVFYLAQPIVDVFREPHSPALRVGVVAVTLVFALSYLVTLGFGMDRGSHAFRVAAVAWLYLMPVLLAVLGSTDLLVFWTYPIAAALVLLPRNVGVAIGFASAVAFLVATGLEQGSPHWDNAMLLVVLTMAMFGFTALRQSIVELRVAKDRVAELAVAEERARVSRDLHDVLGHSLTTITVKAGLARRVLESAGDRDRAVAEISDVEHLSRQALVEVRATVSGYRNASLTNELVGAREALRAAEITADLPHAVDNVAVEFQEPFAYVLREGITNVIRHSGATRCAVRLGDSWIEVHDNGAGASTVDNGQRGHGLTGLAERLAPLGGSVDAGPAEDGGFRLRATVPVPVRS
jgi:two-component system, NarL family, sensor histidine kinase DesK